VCEAKLIVLYASPPHLLLIHVACVKKDNPTANHPCVKGRPVQQPRTNDPRTAANASYETLFFRGDVASASVRHYCRTVTVGDVASLATQAAPVMAPSESDSFLEASSTKNIGERSLCESFA
jgi:hypothetical protein